VLKASLLVDLLPVTNEGQPMKLKCSVLVVLIPVTNEELRMELKALVTARLNSVTCERLLLALTSSVLVCPMPKIYEWLKGSAKVDLILVTNEGLPVLLKFAATAYLIAVTTEG